MQVAVLMMVRSRSAVSTLCPKGRGEARGDEPAAEEWPDEEAELRMQEVLGQVANRC